MKSNQNYGSTIRDIGLDKFFVHFWSHMQLKIYKDNYEKTTVPTISFDATGGCVKKIKRNYNTYSSSIFLYEGVMNINNQTFTVCSMLSEQHDSTSIYLWLKRWLRCDIKPPKLVISDQSLALMSALVHAFTQYQSLEEYLDVCFSIVVKNQNIPIPRCMIKNDINHFMHLVTQWSPLKSTKFTRTKQLIARSMGLLVYSSSINETEQILESIFNVILSKYDGKLLNATNNSDDTPCAKSKRYLQALISSSEVELVDRNMFGDTEIENEEETLEGENDVGDITSSFKEWAQAISDKVRITVNGIEGEYDNAQYLPELEPFIIRSLKLYPCWSGIMGEKFGYGKETSSSSRIESNFNHLKNRVFKNEQMPLRIDNFIEKLMTYYRGDHLLVQAVQGHVLNEDRTSESPPQRSELITLINNDENDSGQSIMFDIYNVKENENNIQKTLSEKTNNCGIQSLCKPCNDGNLPTGLHKCFNCKIPVHLFGCSISIPNTEEGCGEQRLCLSCDKQSSILAESSATENWNRKGRPQENKLKSAKASRSYLINQPGFELVDLNLKRSITPIILLKNGNALMHKPIIIPNVGKIILNNTCSVDSLLSVLATSVADSCVFRDYINSIANSNLTANIILKLISEKQVIKIYHSRAKLMLQYFENKVKLLVGGLKSIDAIDTVASMAEKLLKDMPSFIRTSYCQNSHCSLQVIETTTSKLSINVQDGNISIENEVRDYLRHITEICIYCGHDRDVIIKPTTHILIELNLVPIGKLINLIIIL